jgi:hypothetical protein
VKRLVKAYFLKSPIGEMAKTDDKPFILFGKLGGEMSVNDVPLANGVDVEALKKGDDDPLEVVVEIPASKSKRGWNYTGESLKDIVNHVMSDTLNGFLGHQRPEDVSNQFLPPVTHWVGAKMVGETAYFRGVVDAAAKDLKRWIRSKRIKQVSIYGMPKIQRQGKDTNVVGYKPLSIDWTPLDRAGMNTRIVAAGEMWDLDYKGEMKIEGGGDPVNPEEVLKAIKEMVKNRQITVPMIAGEIGLNAEQIAGEVDSSWVKNLTNSLEKLKKVEEALGVSGEMDVVQIAKDAAEALKSKGTADFDKSVGEMLDHKLQSDAVKKAIKDPKNPLGKMWDYHKRGITPGMDNTVIAGEIDSFLADDLVKDMISKQHIDKPAGTGGAGGGGQNKHEGVRTKRASI